ncbi:DNase I-like protein [Dacryopinax primogenitus]|uniref:DNase I-like protein n=1 Tax=Dacryopinax primogenitus (strain DJM 731) TaxID=1858805 RepID=M5FUP5_DACPD|nr:DNase I-like protein [Dacryopinax primogenitus]EJT99978.1 DNase I-like protein [Dacryopinax primogenitus]
MVNLFQYAFTTYLSLTGQQPMAAQGSCSSRSLRVMTFNIRYDYSPCPPIPTSGPPPVESSPEEQIWGEKRWAERRYRVADTITFHAPDVFGLQEVVSSQMGDMRQLVGSVYDSVGVGRDDGKEKGEYVPVFWNRERFKLLEVNYFWLSPEPDQPGSVGWDAGQTRMCTLVSLLDLTHPSASSSVEGGALFHIANTHYDDRGVQARGESSLLIRRRLPGLIKAVEEKHSVKGEGLVVLLGDFNSPEEEAGYKNIVFPQASSPLQFADTMYSLSLAPGPGKLWEPYGLHYTYTGFQPYDRKERIDFVFMGLRTGRQWKVSRQGVVDNEWRGEKGWKGLSSDHRAVVAEFCT